MVKKYKLNIVKYYAFEFFMGLWFILPISVIFLQNFGISYTQIGILEFTVAFLLIMLEIPTGVFSDFLGKKKTLFLASLFWTLAMFSIGKSSIFSLFLLGFIFWGISDALLSGTRAAFLYDSLKRLNRSSEYLKFKGVSELIIAIATIISSLVGAYLYQSNIRLPWLLFGFSSLIASFFIIISKEPYVNNHKFTLHNQINHAKKSLSFVFSYDVIRWIIIYSAIIILPFALFNNLMKQPYILSLGFQVSSLGWIIALIYGMSGIFSIFSYQIEKFIGEKNSFLLLTILHGVGFMLLGFFKFPALLSVIILIYLARTYKDNVIEYYINKHTESLQRTTVLSAHSFAVNLFASIYVLLGGFLLDLFNLSVVLIGLGSLSLVVGVIHIFRRFYMIRQ